MMPRKLKMMLFLLVWLLMLGLGWVLLGGLMAPPSRALQLSLPDVAVTKYKESGVFAPGHYVEYVIFFENVSLYSATDISIRDTLPISTTYVSSTEPGLILVQAGPDNVRWHKYRLAGFESGWASITVYVHPDAPVGATMTNIVRIETNNPEDNLDNNEYILRDEVRPPGPDLAIRKELQSGTPGPGNQLTYHIHYEYIGAEAADNVAITDTLPLSTTYVADSNSAGFSTVVTGSTVVWEKSSVPADSSGHLDLVVRVSDDFDENNDWLENVVEISTSDAETNYDNNLNRFTIKPEAHKLYGAAVTSVDDKTMQLLSEGGFDWMIYYLDWSEAEPSKGTYNWRDLDSAIWQAWRYHLKLAVRIDRAPAWARPPGGSETAPPSNPDDLKDFVDAMADRTNVPPIDAYIIWNEPNLALEWGGEPPDAAAYTALLQAAYEGINGRGLVVSAGLATTNDNSATAIDDRIYLEQMYANGASSYFDWLGVNPMGFASAPDDTSDPNGYNFSRALEWRQIMVDNGDGAKGMFATEMGWLRDTDIDLGDYNWMKVSDVDQAHYLARAYHKARREWVRPDGTPWMGPMMTWNLDFAAHYPETEHPHWFSVTGDQGGPSRAYLTLKNAATRGPADLWLEKELVSPVTPGEYLVYVIHCTNIGGQPADGVVLTDTLPDYTTYVRDSRGDGTLVGDEVIWNVGTVEAGARETITLTLHLADTVSPDVYLENSVEASMMPGEPYIDDNVATVITGEKTYTDIYLPTVKKSFAPGPDLAVDGLIATSDALTVTIRNAGKSAVVDEFWVEVYFNPRQTPSVNMPWDTIADHGAVWGVTDPIPAGDTLVLTTGGQYYFGPPDSSAPPLPVGADVYALVDSVNYDTSYGMVQESNESNNLYGPVASTQSQAIGNSSQSGRRPSMAGLPPR